MTVKECVLANKACDNCGECLICDLDRSKECNDCMQCIEQDVDFNAIRVDDVVYDEE